MVISQRFFFDHLSVSASEVICLTSFHYTIRYFYRPSNITSFCTCLAWKKKEKKSEEEIVACILLLPIFQHRLLSGCLCIFSARVANVFKRYRWKQTWTQIQIYTDTDTWLGRIVAVCLACCFEASPIYPLLWYIVPLLKPPPPWDPSPTTRYYPQTGQKPHPLFLAQPEMGGHAHRNVNDPFVVFAFAFSVAVSFALCWFFSLCIFSVCVCFFFLLFGCCAVTQIF